MQRWKILALFSASIFIAYLDRVNLSVATPRMLKEFGASIVQMGFIAAAFNFSYMLMQVPIGGLLDRFGVRVIGRISAIGQAIATLGAGPAGGLNIFTAWRGTLGVMESAVFPANGKTMGYWFPLKERSFATSVALASSKISQCVGIPFLAYVVTYWGWRHAFYTTGAMSLVMAAAFWVVYRDPWEHTKITKEEFSYITQGGAQDKGRASGSYKANFAYLLKQRKVWGLIIGYFGFSYNYWLFITWLPAFLVRDMKLSLINSGWYSAITYLAAVISTILIGGYLPDYLIRKGKNRNVVYKSILIGGTVGGLTIVGVAQTSDPRVAVFWLTVAMAAIAPTTAMVWTITSIIAPKGMVGSLGGLTNISMNICGIVAPIATAYIVRATGKFSGAFILDAFVMIFGIVFYVVVLDKIEPIRERVSEPQVLVHSS